MPLRYKEEPEIPPSVSDPSEPDYKGLPDTSEHEGTDAPEMGIEKHNKMVEEAERQEKKWEDEFFPPWPKKRTRKALAKLSLRSKQELFLEAFNASAGVDVVACLYAGITTSTLKEWLKDKKFFEQFEETKKQIAGRLLLILNMRTGLCKRVVRLDDRKLSDHLIAMQIKKLMPETYDRKDTGGNITLKLEIPTPEWDDNDSLSPVPTPGGVPQVEG